MLKLNVSEKAIKSFDIALDWCFFQNGKRSADNFVVKYSEYVELLRSNPYLGIEEGLLKKRKYQYRSIRFDEYHRIIYYVADDVLNIADIWDMRMKTTQLKKRL